VIHRTLIAVLAMIVLAAGGVGAQPSTLTVQTAAEPPGLDLTATPASATAAVVFYTVQECLVKVDRHGKIVPWLAERWHTSDNKNYTFFLKRGVRFHNGRELKAADVKYVLDRIPIPATTRRSATSSSRTTTRSRSRSARPMRTSCSTWRARAR